MSGRYADTVYDRNAPGQQSLQEGVRPGYASNEERLVGEAYAAQAGLDREAVRAMRPARPGALFPPRYVGPRTALGIDDVIRVDRRYPDSSAQFSGTSGGYAGTSVPSIGWW